jgi:hypothetical protein
MSLYCPNIFQRLLAFRLEFDLMNRDLGQYCGGAERKLNRLLKLEVGIYIATVEMVF